MLASILTNYFFGLLIGNFAENDRPRGAKFALTLAIVANLALLGTFKYTSFLVGNLNLLLSTFNSSEMDIPAVHLPIGISFFTFQAVSYLIDVYRKEVDAEKSLINLGLYISLFPQLIAGPIVRFRDIAEQIHTRTHSTRMAYHGSLRFCFGMAKKVLIANPLGELADQLFGLGAAEMSPGMAWLAVAAYTLQIYFDFSAYSDMAIGLGKIFGFKYRENFNYPYVSQSITEFWRRWHISLSSWFRDYLYIPLGGNRAGSMRTYLNLFIVFFLCGLWHGASWNFVIWGLYNGVFLVWERSFFGAMLPRIPRVIRHLYLVVTVMVGWVFFRTETLDEAIGVLAAMFYVGEVNYPLGVESFVTSKIIFIFMLAVVFSAPVYRTMFRLEAEEDISGRFLPLQVILALTLLGLSSIFLAAGSYNPFIYFRF